MLRVSPLLAALTMLVFVSACDDRGSDDPVPSPSIDSSPATAVSPPQSTPAPATPLPTPADIAVTCPVQGDVCEFAGVLASMVAMRDADSIIALSRPGTVTCPDEASEYRAPVCAGLLEGTVTTGFPIAYLQSEGTAISEADLAAWLAGWFDEVDPSQSDDLGSGGWRLATVGCGATRRTGVDTVSCDIRFAVVFTGILPIGTRVLMEFVVEQSPTPAIELFVHGIESINQEFVRGGHNVLPLRFNFEDRNGTDYFPVQTSTN